MLLSFAVHQAVGNGPHVVACTKNAEQRWACPDGDSNFVMRTTVPSTEILLMKINRKEGTYFSPSVVLCVRGGSAGANNGDEKEKAADDWARLDPRELWDGRLRPLSSEVNQNFKSKLKRKHNKLKYRCILKAYKHVYKSYQNLYETYDKLCKAYKCVCN